MAKAPVEMITSAPTKDLAEIFRKSMRVSWFSENVVGAGTTFEKPPRDDAFGDLNNNPPAFEVMAILGGRGAAVQKSAVFMYVWDRGDKREVALTVGKNLAALGLKAKAKMRRFADAVVASYPGTSVSGL